MPLLSAPITYSCYRIGGEEPRQFGLAQLKTLDKFSIDAVGGPSADQAAVGFLAGGHLFDCDFTLEKNVIGDALHCAIRIDTDQIPAAVRKAWLQIELAAAMKDNPGGRPTKVQRGEAKEAVAARCEEEMRSGRFRRMQPFPLLWDARNGLLFFGGASTAAAEQCVDLLGRAFDLELGLLSAGRRAVEWATESRKKGALEEAMPSSFHPTNASAEIAWWSGDVGNVDFLGNEFLLWLWWRWETESDTIPLPDGTEVTGMLARTLVLQCPRGESGKETITAEGPATLPEAAQAIRSGKLPRRAGLTLVRQGEQFDLVLQAETFTVSGAKVHTEEEGAEGRGVLEDRLEGLRNLNETLELLYRAFLEQRVGKSWATELGKIRRWLKD